MTSERPPEKTAKSRAMKKQIRLVLNTTRIIAAYGSSRTYRRV